MTSPVVLWRRLVAEFLGNAFLPAIVVGSGIAAQRLSPGQIGLELLENAAATAVGLYAIILMLGPVSGEQFNPVVSFTDAALGGMSWRHACAYLPAQFAGCTAGAVLANLMFELHAATLSTHRRGTGAHWLAEVIATVGLLLVIFSLARTDCGASAPAAVGAYIGAAYFFTSSTSFANPAITADGCSPTPLPGSPRRPRLATWPPRSSAPHRAWTRRSLAVIAGVTTRHGASCRGPGEPDSGRWGWPFGGGIRARLVFSAAFS